ncbi:hypothetical protein [Pseudoalteromonas sp. MMG012]|uniref:hypothetical protein n=1 Tax=Pseudoalteromonas sp. MMG012 TaxID=2822686 RepID=UPI001B39E1DB|nr:hypothetical protein [Pseudoalteromonas sp. MMG012]MBQ4849234.1 hypothetical protein [Pseudoalteromonas sp. MMG012]
MFNKSLLTVALAAAAFGASASTIEAVNVTSAEVTGAAAAAFAVTTRYDAAGKATAATVSSEGLALASNAITLEAVTAGATDSNLAVLFAPGAKYPNGSAVTFEISGAEFLTTGTNPSLDVAADTSANTPALRDTAQGQDMQFLSRAATKLVFQVNDDADEHDQKFLLNAALTKITGDVTITAFASTPVVSEIDKSSFKISTNKSELAAKATAATGVIDVSKDRLSFVDTVAATGASAKADFSVTVTKTAANILPVSDKAVEMTLVNDLSVFDTDADGLFDDGVTIASKDANVTLTYDKTKKTTVLSRTNAASFANAYGLDFTVPAANKLVLAPTTWTGNLKATYTNGTKDGVFNSTVSFGSWTLNGSVVDVPYMPFGDNTAAILRLTNESSKTGDLTVRYMLEADSAGNNAVTAWKSVGVVASIGPGVTNISDVVMNAIKADAGVTKGKVAIELTTNVPTADVSVTAIFKVISEQDRGVVATK